MKKHLLATLCISTIAALPACMGCCERDHVVKEETVVIADETPAQPTTPSTEVVTNVDVESVQDETKESTPDTNKF